jgi:hypothetical protein
MAEESGFTFEQLQKILEEIANYHVELDPDPTQPHLGIKYLQQKIAQCRNFLNRVQYYLQIVGRFERDLKVRLQIKETDIEFKINMKLADDPVVKQQPTLDERKAVAIATLKDEYEDLTECKRRLLDAQETLKLLKMKYGDLRATSGDIKAQRQLVKDDMQAWTEGGQGYTRPQARADGSIPDGMPPPVTTRIDPRDVLDPNKKPDDLPKPRDEIHAQQIASFFGSGAPEKPDQDPPKQEESAPIAEPSITYDDLLK